MAAVIAEKRGGFRQFLHHFSDIAGHQITPINHIPFPTDFLNEIFSVGPHVEVIVFGGQEDSPGLDDKCPQVWQIEVRRGRNFHEAEAANDLKKSEFEGEELEYVMRVVGEETGFEVDHLEKLCDGGLELPVHHGH